MGWKRIITMALMSPMPNYKGHLDDCSFIDIPFLGCSQVWNVDPSINAGKFEKSVLTSCSKSP